MKKRNFYRLMALALALVMLFAVVACTQDGDTAETGDTSATTPQATTKATTPKRTTQATTAKATTAATTAKPVVILPPVSATPGIAEDLKAQVDKAIAGTFTADKWDGTTADTSWYADGTSTFELDSAAKLAGMMKLLGEGKNFLNKTVKLTANINLDGKDWPAITSSFRGVLDGNNHVIANYKLVITEGASGFFGSLDGDAIVQNIGFVNCTYDGNGKNSVGFLAGTVNPGDGYAVNISNVYYSATGNAESLSGKNIGLIGNINDYGNLSISNCLVEGSIYTGSGSKGQAVGGYIGMITKGATIDIVNTVCNTDISAGRFSSGFIGAVGSSAGARITITGCVNNGDMTSSGAATGGFIGYGISSSIVTADIENCTNNGKISGSKNVGGIIGQCDVGKVTVKSCTNTGMLSAANNDGLGGMVGESSGSCTLVIEGCTNTGAPELPEVGTPAA